MPSITFCYQVTEVDLKHDRGTNRMRGNVCSPRRISYNIDWLNGYITCIFLLVSYTGTL